MDARYIHQERTLDQVLDHLIEECGEFLQACIKLRRFGPDAIDPNTGQKYDNLSDTLFEALDIRVAAESAIAHLNQKIGERNREKLNG